MDANLDEIDKMLFQFKKDIQFGYSVQLALSRAWMHAKDQGTFKNKNQLIWFISRMKDLSEHYKTDFFSLD